MEYWIIIDDRHDGPYSAARLLELGLKPDTPVWAPGLPDWVEAAEVDELKRLLEKPAEPEEKPAEKPADKPAEAPAPAPVQPAQLAPAPVAPAPAPMPAPAPVQGPVPAPAVQPLPAPQPLVFPQQPMQQPVQPVQPMAPQPPVFDWQKPDVQPDKPCPPAYLAWSIIVTILCCQPLGIGAIICSALTKQNYRRGNLEKAEKLSEWAQWLIILAIVLGLISLPVQLAFMDV